MNWTSRRELLCQLGRLTLAGLGAPLLGAVLKGCKTLEAVSDVGAQIGEATQRQIQRGKRLQAVLTQPAHRPLPLASQIVILLVATEGLLDDIPLSMVSDFEHDVLGHIEETHPGLVQQINRSGELEDETRQVLAKELANYHSDWLTSRGLIGKDQ